MDNKNIPWIVIGVLSVALFFVGRNSPVINSLLHSQQQPPAQRPFADEWTLPPGTPPTGVAPQTYAEAVAAAKQTNKPVLLFFTSKTCPPCQQMKKELAPSLPSLTGQVIWFEVDATANADLCKKYNVSVTPSYLVINPQEQVLKTGSGYKDVKGFGDWLAAPYVTPPPPPVAPPTKPPTPPEKPKRQPLLRQSPPGN